ncbi:hypothetical protein PRIPAC_86322 [Pristionchus pacificus]|uniref:Uncharacterized protein n=1 Tax=Pristionchus pacificus TaxID=54126 RepID=A0A2A6BM95_PRIPA|nr:hypothetical protein PRIPAC_86322 [Pristionchus pacificus]|eukprot:PDM66933.1 hypothetical protein PRIPAC_48350 [Pristionchus pacificus]
MARATKNVGKKSGKKEEKKGVQKKTSAKNVQKATKARAGKKGQSQKTTPAKKPTSASNRKSKPQVAPSKPMRKFRQRATIGQEDLLSRLPSDCLNPILYMMNQYELNVLSTASQTLYAATVIARPKSIKRRFANITISQVDYYKTFVVISKPDPRRNNYHRTYAVRLDRATDRYETYFRKQDNILKIPVAHYIVRSTLKLSLIAPLHHKVRYHLLPRLVRLSFDSYTFDAIGIDEQFLQDFENIRSQPLKSLKFERCAFDKNSAMRKNLGFCLSFWRPSRAV